MNINKRNKIKTTIKTIFVCCLLLLTMVITASAEFIDNKAANTVTGKITKITFLANGIMASFEITDENGDKTKIWTPFATEHVSEKFEEYMDEGKTLEVVFDPQGLLYYSIFPDKTLNNNCLPGHSMLVLVSYIVLD